MFYSADPMEQTLDGSDSRYYESIDMEEAYHPQTILAYEMNDQVLPIPYGAPLRLRDERQLGYKMAKYIMRIELVDSFAKIRGGRGGYWEDLGMNGPEKVRPAPGEEPAARTRSGDGEGWGRDRGRKLLSRSIRGQRDDAVAGAERGSPSETQTFGSDCDWRLTKR